MLATPLAWPFSRILHGMAAATALAWVIRPICFTEPEELPMSHASTVTASASHVRAGGVALALLRFTLIGVAAALAGVVLHIAFKLFA